MTVIKLSDNENDYKKYKAIETVGFKATKVYGGFTLIDKLVSAEDQCLDMIFTSLNDILNTIVEYLLKANIILAA